MAQTRIDETLKLESIYLTGPVPRNLGVLTVLGAEIGVARDHKEPIQRGQLSRDFFGQSVGEILPFWVTTNRRERQNNDGRSIVNGERKSTRRGDEVRGLF